MEAYREEFFGPVGVVYRVADEDAAVTLANDTSFGLGSYVYTNDPKQAARVADRIEAGMVYVNIVGADSPELPFGGVKRSGTARELGLLAADMLHLPLPPLLPPPGRWSRRPRRIAGGARPPARSGTCGRISSQRRLTLRITAFERVEPVLRAPKAGDAAVPDGQLQAPAGLPGGVPDVRVLVQLGQRVFLDVRDGRRHGPLRLKGPVICV